MAEYIKREALITELNNMAIELIKDNTIQCSLAAGTVVEIKDNVVKKQPAADVVEVKHGYWKEPNGGGYQCTVCRSFFDNYYGFDAKDRCFYCPTCGAKMDLKEGAEE